MKPSARGFVIYIFELATRLPVKRQLILRRDCVQMNVDSGTGSPVCVSLASACE